MGVNLVLNKDNVEIQLGRSYNYYIDGSLPQNDYKIDKEYSRILNKAKIKLAGYSAYTPHSMDDLDDVQLATREYVEYIFDEAFRCGRASVIVDLIEEGFTASEV